MRETEMTTIEDARVEGAYDSTYKGVGRRAPVASAVEYKTKAGLFEVQ
jgi:hypothetical protein